jgi:3-deoxy-D-manno-octulosonic acid kinase
MKPVEIVVTNAYRIGTNRRLSPEHIGQLAGVFGQPTLNSTSILGGRTAVSTIHLNDLGSVVIKHYRRGGWLRRLVTRTYLRWGRPRCRIEFDMLQEARRLGIRAPEPIAFAYKGRIFYRCWLVTREIQIRSSLAELSRSDPRAALEVLPRVAEQISRLIEHRIWHVDLHPGNILVDDQSKIHLIDFDRARHVRWDRARLHGRYVNRWKRAVSKHGLPPQLTRNLVTALARPRFE